MVRRKGGGGLKPPIAYALVINIIRNFAELAHAPDVDYKYK